MNKLNRFFLCLFLVEAFLITLPAQELQKDEFVSIIGRFKINLPQQAAEYKAVLEFQIAGQKFVGSSYKWNLDVGQAIVSFGDCGIDLEAQPYAETFLKAIRGDYAAKVSSTVANEKQTSLDGHLGLIFVMQVEDARIISWVYLTKNRFYLLSLSLKQTQGIKGAVNALSSFKLLFRSDVEIYNRKTVESLTTPPLPQEPIAKKSTSDAQDNGLIGKIKQVVTEGEEFVGANLFGFRTLGSVDDYNEQGNLTKRILYGKDLPQAVQVYGYLNGERVFRELEKDYGFVMVSSDPKQKDTVTKRSTPQPKIHKIKYKYNEAGQLTEMQVVQEDGKEVEKYVYKIKDRKVEHTFYVGFGFVKLKTVGLLDDKGNVIEETLFSPGVPESVYYRDSSGNLQNDQKQTLKEEKFSYKYEFDEKRNWIKRTKSQIVKENGKMVEKPVVVTYRTTIYY